MLSSSGLYDSVELLIDIDGVLNIVTCYMLHVTCYVKDFAILEKGVKKHVKE